jgi:hypothetical protein
MTTIALFLALYAGPVAADEPATTSRIVTASDLAAGPYQLTLPREGRYLVWVYASPKESWTSTTVGSTITLRPGSPNPFAHYYGLFTDHPIWQPVHTRMSYDPKSPPTLLVAPAEDAKPAPEAKKGAAPKPIPVPTLLRFETLESATSLRSGLRASIGVRDSDITKGLDLIRGNVKSTAPVPDPRRTTVRTRNEGANFTPPTTRQAWLDRAEHVREQILVSNGLWPMFPKTDMHPRVFGKLDRDGYTIEKFVLETLPGFTLCGNIYRPEGKTGKLPVVLCPHGHWKDGRVNPTIQARCIWWAKRMGCVVLSYDMVGYNDSKPFGHEFLNDRLRRWGLSLMTLQTWNSTRLLDWAVTLPDVDPARVGCTGESGGGTQTFILAAIDPRVKVAAPVVMVSHKMQGGCLCENCAGLRIGTDNVEIAALTAPRPMKLVGANDWTDETMTNEYPTLRKIYTLLGTPDRISADKFEFEHNYNETSRNAVYPFMGKWLVGMEDSQLIREHESDLKMEAPEDLWAFDKDHPAPKDTKTPEQLEAELIGVMGRGLDKLAPTTVAAPWESSRNLLLKSLRIRVGLTDPPPSDLTMRAIRFSARDGFSCAHLTVSRASTGDCVPVIRFTPKAPNGRATLIFTPRGKADLATADGKPIPLVEALLDRGQTVIGFDPLFVGESIDPRSPATARRKVDHFETYNPTLAADHAQDLATVLAWSRSRPDIREVSLVALGQSGPLALIARPVLTGLARTAIDLDGFDYGDGSGKVPPALDLPGVLQFGGLESAAALSAPGPLWISRAPSGFDTAWPLKAYALADATSMFKVEETAFEPAALARWIDAGE